MPIFNILFTFKEDTKNINRQLSGSQLLQTVPQWTPSQNTTRNKIVLLESEPIRMLLAPDVNMKTNEATKKTSSMKEIPTKQQLLKL